MTQHAANWRALLWEERAVWVAVSSTRGRRSRPKSSACSSHESANLSTILQLPFIRSLVLIVHDFVMIVSYLRNVRRVEDITASDLCYQLFFGLHFVIKYRLASQHLVKDDTNAPQISLIGISLLQENFRCLPSIISSHHYDLMLSCISV